MDTRTRHDGITYRRPDRIGRVGIARLDGSGDCLHESGGRRLGRHAGAFDRAIR